MKILGLKKHHQWIGELFKGQFLTPGIGILNLRLKDLTQFSLQLNLY